MNDRSIARSAPRPLETRRAGALSALVLLALFLAAAARADALKDGKTALAAGKVDEAIAQFRTAVEGSPNDVQPQLQLGIALERKRNWQAALETFKRASELDPRLAEPWRGQGSCLLRLDRPAESEVAFRKATDFDRKFPDAVLGLGEALVRQKKIDEAVSVLQGGLKFGSKTLALFYEGLGRAEAARDSLSHAEVYLLKAREAAPKVGRIQRSLGDLYMQRKIPSLAIASYKAALELDAHDPDTRVALGDAYYKGQLYNDAREQYEAVAAADSQNADAFYKLGNLYYLASQSDPQRVFSAIATLEHLAQIAPNDLRGKALLAQCYYRRGGVQGKADAKKLLDEILAAGQMPPEAWRTLGIMQYEGGQYREALGSFARAPKLEAIDQFRIGDIYRTLSSHSADSTAKAAFLDSADSVYAALGAADSTTDDARRALLERGKVRYQRKDYAGAIPMFQRMIALDPKNGEAYYYLGLSLRAREDNPAALEALREAARLDPNVGARLFWLGAAFVKVDSTAQAKQAFERSVELDSTSVVSAVALQQLGYFALLAKDYPEAIRRLERSVAIDPKQVQSWVWLAQAYQNSGNRARAIEYYRKALQLNPKEPNSLKALKALGAP